MAMAMVMATPPTTAPPDGVTGRATISARWRAVPLALFGLALAWAAATNAIANHWRVTAPDAALRWRAGDATALVLREDQRLVRESEAGRLAAPRPAIARQALRAEPLTAPALRQLGIADALAGRPDAARGLMHLAHATSRRELGAQIWLIDDSIRRGGLAPALRHFDEALSTHLVAAQLLVPALSSALFDPALRAGLVPYLRAERPWMPRFLLYAANTPASVQYAADLVIAAHGLPQSPPFDDINSRILSGLAAIREFATARVYIDRLLRSKRQGDHPDFFDAQLGPFTWLLANRAGLDTQMDRAGKLYVHIGVNQHGVAATRILTLPFGRYRVAGATSIAPGASAHARWDIQCMTPGLDHTIWKLDLDSSQSGNLPDLHIPRNCLGQKVMLTVGNSGLDAIDTGPIDAGFFDKLMLRRDFTHLQGNNIRIFGKKTI